MRNNRGTVGSGVFVVHATAIATQQCGKIISAATNPDTIEELCFLLVQAKWL
jgi:hypothetical protein